jgi:hypothetical protein
MDYVKVRISNKSAAQLPDGRLGHVNRRDFAVQGKRRLGETPVSGTYFEHSQWKSLPIEPPYFCAKHFGEAVMQAPVREVGTAFSILDPGTIMFFLKIHHQSLL